MMGLLVQRAGPWHRVVPRIADRPVQRPQEYDTWMGIYAASESGEERKLGFLHTESHRATRNGEEGTVMGLTVNLATRMMDMPTQIAITGTAWSTLEDGLSDFNFRVQSFDHELRIGGKVDNGRLRLEIETAHETFPIDLPVGRGLLLSGSFGIATLNLPVLEVGEEVLVDVFDPLTLASGKARIACVGTEMIELNGEPTLVKVLTSTASGLTSKVWVTVDEEIVRVETPFGFVLRKERESEAIADLGESGSGQLFDMMAIRPSGKRPFKGATRMEVQLGGVPANIEPPSGAIQRNLGGNRYRIESPPTQDAGLEPLIDSAPFLLGGPFVQVGHPRIQSALDEIIGNEEDPNAIVQLIYEWIYEEIEKIIVLSFPSALDVLDSREGDCNEHTVLFTALARTAGIPTRIAIGIVWSEEYNGFYYHAWPEVYVDRWRAVDPTLGQPIADATHIKLLTGNIERWAALAPFLGQLEVEVLEIQ